MSDYLKYIDSVGVEAVERVFDRRIGPSEYMAVHIAIKAMVDAVVLISSMGRDQS